MSTETIQTVGKYLIALGLIVGWIVRDSAGQQATTNAVKTITAATGGSA